MNPRIRAIVSTLLILVFAQVAVSGLLLFLLPHGHDLRHPMEHLHTMSGLLMTPLVLLHLVVNWRMYLGEIRALIGP